MSTENLQELLADLRQKLQRLTPFVPDLVGLDRGFRMHEGSPTGEVGYRAFVRTSRGAGGDPAPQPDLARILEEPTDAIDLSSFEALPEGAPKGPPAGAEPARRLNPIQPGISVSHNGQGSGTLGLVAYRPTGEPVAVSCAHVLAGPFARRDDPVFQPGVLDGGDPDFDAIGYLADWFVDEDGDAAYAELNRARMVGREQLATRDVVHRAALAGLGDRLQKTGRGSGRTSARVDGIGLYRLALPRSREVWMSGFRLVPEAEGPEEISRPGDSGAVWYREGPGGGEGVGLHVDGEGPSGDGRPGYAIACHLPVVLERFGLTLSPPRPPQPPRPARDRSPSEWSESAWRIAEWVHRHPAETAELADVLAGMAREGRAAAAPGLTPL
jgi:hypothetical protein